MVLYYGCYSVRAYLFCKSKFKLILILIFIIVADGAYTPSAILLTPFQNANEDTPEGQFNKSLIESRVIAEEIFRDWRCMFSRVLKDRTLNFGPGFAAQIVTATGVLYNSDKMHR